MRHDSFDDWSDQDLNQFMQENGFLAWRRLATGEVVALLKLMFTLSVCCDVTPSRVFQYRWCFEDPSEAMHFYSNIQEFDEIPTIRSSLKGHRYLSKPLLVEYDQFGYAKW